MNLCKKKKIELCSLDTSIVFLFLPSVQNNTDVPPIFFPPLNLLEISVRGASFVTGSGSEAGYTTGQAFQIV